MHQTACGRQCVQHGRVKAQLIAELLYIVSLLLVFVTNRTHITAYVHILLQLLRACTGRLCSHTVFKTVQGPDALQHMCSKLTWLSVAVTYAPDMGSFTMSV